MDPGPHVRDGAGDAGLVVTAGGYGATRILPHLSLDSVKRANKWLIGFSDTTALHCL